MEKSFVKSKKSYEINGKIGYNTEAVEQLRSVSPDKRTCASFLRLPASSRKNTSKS